MIEWSEERHSDPSPGHLRVEAQVTHISAVHAQLERFPNENAYQPVKGVLSPRPPPTGGIQIRATKSSSGTS